MKKCLRCKMVFNHEERARCLYCDSILMSVDQDEAQELLQEKTAGGIATSQLAKDRDMSRHENMRYLVGSYFRVRTFHFLYCFSRNEFKMGKEYKRFWVQPFDITSILALPWVAVNVVDSLFFRGIHNGYCADCNWKYLGGHLRHDPVECEYNQEYTSLVKEVFNGHIAQTEDTFQQQALEKIHQGKRSAYFDLCSRKSKYEGVLDVACIWFSCGILVYLLVLILLPLGLKIIYALSSGGE